MRQSHLQSVHRKHSLTGNRHDALPSFFFALEGLAPNNTPARFKVTSREATRVPAKETSRRGEDSSVHAWMNANLARRVVRRKRPRMMRIMSWTRTMAGGRVVATRMQHRRSSSRPSSHHRSWPPRRPSADPLPPFQPPPAAPPGAPRRRSSTFRHPVFFPPHSESVDTWSEQETPWESEQSVFRGCVAHTASRDATAEGTRARARARARAL